MRCIKCGVESKQVLCSACFANHNKLAYSKRKPPAAAESCWECESYRNHTCMETDDYISNPRRENC